MLKKSRNGCPCVRQEGTWKGEGKVALLRNLDTIRMSVLAQFQGSFHFDPKREPLMRFNYEAVLFQSLWALL
jgi:hypothetical protein